jgi:hypothetical protein
MENMTTTELRKNAKDRLDSLPPDKVKVAAEFLEYLENAASRDATEELLKIPGILEDVIGSSIGSIPGRKPCSSCESPIAKRLMIEKNLLVS